MHRTGLSRGARRQRLIVGIMVAGAVAVGLTVAPNLAGAAPPPPIETDLSKYVLFAQDSLHFKGQNNGKGQITGGHVGVNNPGGQLNMCGGGSPHPVTMSPGSQASADFVSIGSPCEIETLFYGGDDNWIGGGNPTVVNKVARSPWTQIVPDSALANPPAPGPCTGDLDVKDGQSAVISADAVFCNMRLGRNATVTVNLFDPAHPENGHVARSTSTTEPETTTTTAPDGTTTTTLEILPG